MSVRSVGLSRTRVLAGLRFLALAIALAAIVLLSSSGGAAAALFHAPHVQASNPGVNATAYSTNWSGYATYKSGATFSDVKGTWTQPAVNCPSKKKQYASFWVGTDGYNSNTVQQIGTDSDCNGLNRPVYYAWYEMYPAYPVNLSMAIRPGDTISAEVSVSGSTFTLSITDVTTGAAFSTQQTSTSAVNTSAEWVAEAPSMCSIFSCTVLPLANFGRVNFSGSYNTSNGHTGSISDAAWSNDQIVMVTNSGTVKAQPSALSPDGTAFSVTWQHQ